MSRKPKSTLAVAAVLLSSWPLPPAAAPAPAASAPNARDLHAARCVAALDVLTQELVPLARAGDAAARTVLLDRLTAAAAFVGEAYLRGTIDEAHAKAARQQALLAQKKLSADELAARQDACAREGTALYTSANALQQFVLRRTAQRRLARMLADTAPPPAEPRRPTEGAAA